MQCLLRANVMIFHACHKYLKIHLYVDHFLAVCNGLTNLEDACHQTAYVMKKPGTSLEKSTGSCVSPEKCAGCGMYFYSNGPICTRMYTLIYICFIIALTIHC